MLASVRALLTGIIDYAGMFPPAQLPLPEAMRNYVRHATSPEAWMLARFVCPVARLDEAARLEIQVLPELTMTALGPVVQDPANFVDQFAQNLAAVEKCRSDGACNDVVEMLEVALPATCTPNEVESLLRQTVALWREQPVRCFFEVPLSDRWADLLEVSCHTLSPLVDRQGPGIGLKMRCGGMTREAFPSDEQVAVFIVRGREAGLPWKATAGLHHPYRQRDERLGVWMHGFLNVFGAGVLARVHALGPAQVVEILRDADGAGFWFEDERFGWRDWSCTAQEVAAVRSRWLPSFGSCSFEEPVNDLRTLGLLPHHRAGGI